MRRREFLQTAGLAAAGITAGCAARKPPIAAAPPPPAPASQTPTASARPMPNLALPRISWDRVIRTTIGLRPHRDSGFVLRLEKLEEATVMYNEGFERGRM